VSLIAGLLLTAAVAWFLGRPLLRGAAEATPAAAPDARDEILLRQLSELEYDFRMGKIGGEDYAAQRASLLRSRR